MSRKLKNTPKCGAKSRNGECQREAGWGTDHLGFGPCKLHMGKTPSINKAMIRKKLAAEWMEDNPLLGTDKPIELDPDALLIQVVRRTAGVLAWLENKVQSLDETELTQVDDKGVERPSVWVTMHAEERDRLANHAKIALAAGVAERAIALAENQGQLIAKALQGIMLDLDLTADQKKRAPEIMRRRLTEIVMEVEAA